MLVKKIVFLTCIFTATILTACEGGSSSNSSGGSSNNNGRCRYPSDRAADGSRCGDRASSVRPGGN